MFGAINSAHPLYLSVIVGHRKRWTAQYCANYDLRSVWIYTTLKLPWIKPRFDVSEYSTLVPGMTLLHVISRSNIAFGDFTSVHSYPRCETIAGSRITIYVANWRSPLRIKHRQWRQRCSYRRFRIATCLDEKRCPFTFKIVLSGYVLHFTGRPLSCVQPCLVFSMGLWAGLKCSEWRF